MVCSRVRSFPIALRVASAPPPHHRAAVPYSSGHPSFLRRYAHRTRSSKRTSRGPHRVALAPGSSPSSSNGYPPPPPPPPPLPPLLLSKRQRSNWRIPGRSSSSSSTSSRRPRRVPSLRSKDLDLRTQGIVSQQSQQPSEGRGRGRGRFDRLLGYRACSAPRRPAHAPPRGPRSRSEST